MRSAVRSVEEAVGHSEALDMRQAVEHWKASGLDLTPILHYLLSREPRPTEAAAA